MTEPDIQQLLADCRRPRPTPETPISVRLEPEMRERLNKVCERFGISQTDVIRTALKVLFMRLES